ncbi:hypothetical protein [Bacillus sp. UMB0728]|uniref:hypothetical protein n=1 Tax=Bacillus sp. UMB0728 TaxID=2066052 RepID=UPI000C78B3FF|nr:hypothetical protein [Bacillus sp. UMB0728]PLR70457.1 hypothetical protein CYJ37_23255 [Bacillus sp. UMB0728]
MAKIYATCTLCQNYDPNRNQCSLTQEEVNPLEYAQPAECQKSGQFVRDLNVIPDVYHYFPKGENVPRFWQPDFSRLPKDEDDNPLFVSTRRGYERAIPADPSLKLKGDILVGVSPKILTYQGQRETIYDLGVELAQSEAAAIGVPLHILPEEVDWPGIPKLKQAFLNRQGRHKNPKNQWFSDEPIEQW